MRSEYFSNHERRDRFPWSVYHAPLCKLMARGVSASGVSPDVLIVGCGLEPFVPGASARYFGCDLDADAIAECRRLYPQMASQLEVCPSPYELPGPPFPTRFDVVVAKEVIEHVPEPARWATQLAGRVKRGGVLLLSTPNYAAWSSLSLIERTVLELVARRDGYTRKNMHVSRFSPKRLAELDVGEGMSLVDVRLTWTRWALVGRWRRLR